MFNLVKAKQKLKLAKMVNPAGLFEPWEEVLQEVEKLQDAIRKHRDMRADDRCVGDDYELYQVLGETIPQHACQLNCPEIMLEDCRRFIESRHDPNKPYLSPQREIERLEAEIVRLEEELRNSKAKPKVSSSMWGKFWSSKW